MIKIMLDAGHGAGKQANRGFLFGENEGDFNWKCVEYFRKYAKETYGIPVGTTRPKITDNPDLKPRGNMAKNHDLFISWHSNAYNGQARGVEIYDDVNPKFSNASLANKILTAVSSTLGIPNRGVKYRKYEGGNYYGVLRNGLAKSNMLLEVCFHDNPLDARVYIDKWQEVVEAICDTIMSHYGVQKVQPQPQPTSQPKEEFMLKTAILVGSHADVPNVEMASVKYNAPIYFRGTNIPAEHLIVAGAKVPQGFKGRITNLTGADRLETAENIKRYMRR